MSQALSQDCFLFHRLNSNSWPHLTSIRDVYLPEQTMLNMWKNYTHIRAEITQTSCGGIHLCYLATVLSPFPLTAFVSPTVSGGGGCQLHLLCGIRRNGGDNWEVYRQRLLPAPARPSSSRRCPRSQGLWDVRETDIKAVKRLSGARRHDNRERGQSPPTYCTASLKSSSGGDAFVFFVCLVFFLGDTQVKSNLVYL